MFLPALWPLLHKISLCRSFLKNIIIVYSVMNEETMGCNTMRRSEAGNDRVFSKIEGSTANVDYPLTQPLSSRQVILATFMSNPNSISTVTEIC